jgi:hypothetical protein
MLEERYQAVIAKLIEEEIELPQDIDMPGFDGKNGTMKFRIWNSYSWINAHQEGFKGTTIYKQRYKDQYSKDVFIQFIGTIPDNDWFLEAVLTGALQAGKNQKEQTEEYLDKRGLPHGIFKTSSIAGVILPDNTIANYILHAKRTAVGTEEDPKIFFSIEPLLVAATVGTFSFVTFSKKAMRIGELQQVCWDKKCLGGLYLAQYNDETKEFENCNDRRYLWNLFPKGHREKREVYEVDEVINSLMHDQVELHKRYLGYEIQKVKAAQQQYFTHSPKYIGKFKFILQWQKKHMKATTINACMTLMLLNHGCKDRNGQPVHITSHDIRHSTATFENRNGVQLIKLMELLHHVNPDTTMYYSELPFVRV